MNIFEVSLRWNASLKGFVEDSYYYKKRPAVIIVPGGSYLYKSRREGDPVALKFCTMDYQSFVLDYSTIWNENYIRNHKPVVNNAPAPWPIQGAQLLDAVKYVRDNADRFGIDPQRIYVLGFSAGGHVCATAGLRYNDPEFLKTYGFDEPVKINGEILCYPLLNSQLIQYLIHYPANDELKLTGPYIIESIFAASAPTQQQFDQFNILDKITPDFPPTFLWHTTKDQIVPSTDSCTFARILMENRVPCEFHLFSSGRHGMSLATPYVAAGEGDHLEANALWPMLADLFLKSLK